MVDFILTFMNELLEVQILDQLDSLIISYYHQHKYFDYHKASLSYSLSYLDSSGDHYDQGRSFIDSRIDSSLYCHRTCLDLLVEVSYYSYSFVIDKVELYFNYKNNNLEQVSFDIVVVIQTLSQGCNSKGYLTTMDSDSKRVNQLVLQYAFIA